MTSGYLPSEEADGIFPGCQDEAENQRFVHDRCWGMLPFLQLHKIKQKRAEGAATFCRVGLLGVMSVDAPGLQSWI